MQPLPRPRSPGGFGLGGSARGPPAPARLWVPSSELRALTSTPARCPRLLPRPPTSRAAGPRPRAETGCTGSSFATQTPTQAQVSRDKSTITYCPSSPPNISTRFWRSREGPPSSAQRPPPPPPGSPRGAWTHRARPGMLRGSGAGAGLQGERWGQRQEEADEATAWPAFL